MATRACASASLKKKRPSWRFSACSPVTNTNSSFPLTTVKTGTLARRALISSGARARSKAGCGAEPDTTRAAVVMDCVGGGKGEETEAVQRHGARGHHTAGEHKPQRESRTRGAVDKAGAILLWCDVLLCSTQSTSMHTFITPKQNPDTHRQEHARLGSLGRGRDPQPGQLLTERLDPVVGPFHMLIHRSLQGRRLAGEVFLPGGDAALHPSLQLLVRGRGLRHRAHCTWNYTTAVSRKMYDYSRSVGANVRGR